MSAESPASAPAPASRGAHGGIARWLVWLFAAIGVAGLLSVIFLAVAMFSFRGGHQPAKVAGADPKRTFTISNASNVRGTNLISVDVLVAEGGGSSGYSGGGEDKRNILLIDQASGSSRRLLASNEMRIHEEEYFPAASELPDAPDLQGGDKDEDAPPIVYYLLSLTSPEGGNGRDLVVGRIDGTQQGVVMRGMDGIHSAWMRSPTQLAVIVRDKLNLYYRVVDMPTLKVVQNNRIAIE